MTDHDALLAAILANRADDTPRLAMADWLEEHGQPERAEFIRVQIKIAQWSGKWGSGWESGSDEWKEANECKMLHERERSLLEARRYSWLDGMLGDGWKLMGMQGNLVNYHRVLEYTQSINPEFSRGFVSTLTLQWSDWLAHHAAILGRQPVERVKLTTRPMAGEHCRWWSRNVDDKGQFTAIVAGCNRLGRGDTIDAAILDAFKQAWQKIEFELPPVDLDAAVRDNLSRSMAAELDAAWARRSPYPYIPANA